jgi:hypothetical protein
MFETLAPAMSDDIEDKLDAEIAKVHDEAMDEKIEREIAVDASPRPAPGAPLRPTTGRFMAWWQTLVPWQKGAFLVGAVLVAFWLFNAASGGSLTHPTPDAVDIQYSGCWSGAVQGGGSQSSYEGCGPRRIYVNGWPVSAVIQKMDDDYGTLTVTLLDGTKTLKSASTSAQYGIASVAA